MFFYYFAVVLHLYLNAKICLVYQCAVIEICNNVAIALQYRCKNYAV